MPTLCRLSRLQLYVPATLHARQRNGKSRAEFKALDWPRKMGGLIVCNQNAPPPLKRLPTEQGRRAEDEIGNPLDQRHC